jgi:hypothetical protein
MNALSVSGFAVITAMPYTSGADAGIQVAHESGHSKNDLRLIPNIYREVVGVANYQSVVVEFASGWHCGFYRHSHRGQSRIGKGATLWHGDWSLRRHRAGKAAQDEAQLYCVIESKFHVNSANKLRKGHFPFSAHSALTVTAKTDLML